MNGEQALRMANEFEVDLVLTDVNMPRRDGISLTRELCAHEKHWLTPIMTLTTESSHERKMEVKASLPVRLAGS